MTAKPPSLSLALPFEPMPSPRPRVRLSGRFASIYMPGEYQAWKEAVAECARGSIPEPVSPDLFAGPVSVEVEFISAKPKSTKLPHPRPDLDNFEKSVLDALTESGAVWRDDSQVARIQSSKRWTQPGEPPGINIQITYTHEDHT